MSRPGSTKIQKLEARHPGLCSAVHVMFDQAWSVPAVKQMIQSRFGERLSLASLERYKRDHWRTQRERVQQIRTELAAREAAEQALLGVLWTRLPLHACAKTDVCPLLSVDANPCGTIHPAERG